MRHLIGAVSASAVLLFAPAYALNNPLPGSSAVIDKVSSNAVIAFLQGAGVAASYVGEEPSGDKTIVATAGTQTAYIILRNCDGSGPGAGCGLVQPFGRFNAQGVTFDQINNFNMNVGINSFAGLFPDGTGLVASKTYLNGGVTFEHAKFGIATLFADLDRLAASINPGVLARTSWKKALPDQGLVMSLPSLPDGSAPHVNAVGTGGPGLLTGEMRAVLASGGVATD